MSPPIPADWEEFYRIAAAKEAADGNGKACRTLLRYARIERVSATLSHAVGTQDADRHLAGGVRVPGLSSEMVPVSTHNGAVIL